MWSTFSFDYLSEIPSKVTWLCSRRWVIPINVFTDFWVEFSIENESVKNSLNSTVGDPPFTPGLDPS